MNLLRLAVCSLCLASALMAADASGIWTGQFPGRNGTFQDINFKLAQKGNVLTGKLYGDFGSMPVTEGKITGDQVTFTIATREQVGNLFNEVKYVFTGTFDGAEFHLTRERQGPPPEGNEAKKANPKPSFTLKRLL